MTNNKVIKKSGASLGRVAAVAAISAGVYHFLGPNGKKNQKEAKEWFANAKREIAKKSKPVISDMKKIVKDIKNIETKTKKKVSK